MYWINVAQDGGSGRLLLILRYTADFLKMRGICRLTGSVSLSSRSLHHVASE